MPTSNEVAFVRPPQFIYPFEDDDYIVPSGTWLSDFVESMRGIETPTMFSLWAALWALSASTVREVGLRWLEGEPLFPNLYVFLVAPAGRCHKTTAIKHAFKVLNALHNEFPGAQDPNRTLDEAFLREMTKFAWVTSKTTPEGFERVLVTDEDIPLTHIGGVTSLRRGAQMTICAGQLDTFLNKRKYTGGMTETLTELYDCMDFTNYLTKGGGNVELRDIYVTLIGAITPKEMKDCLPDESRGDGFMSRVCMISRARTLRNFPEPIKYEGFPTIRDLSRKLAFLVKRGRSLDYTLTPEAREYYNAWYRDWKRKIDEDDTYIERTGENRFDVLVKRLALLIRFSRYEEVTHKVDVKDIEDAFAILRNTFATASSERRVLSAREGFGENYQVILRYITNNARAGTIERKRIISYMSSRSVPSRDVDVVIKQLEEEGVLECPDNAALKKGQKSYRVITRIEDAPQTEEPEAT